MNELIPESQSSSPPPENPFLELNAFSQVVGSPVFSSAQQTILPPPTSQPSSFASSEPVSPTVSIGDSSLPTGAFTVTMGPSGVQWPLTVTPQGYYPMVIEPSGYEPSAAITVSETSSMVGMGSAPSPGLGGTVTVIITPTFTPSPVTVVLVSMETETVTATVSGTLSVFTTT
jgi:hypothetical protein